VKTKGGSENVMTEPSGFVSTSLRVATPSVPPRKEKSASFTPLDLLMIPVLKLQWLITLIVVR
jgi:hypothetical protein